MDTAQLQEAVKAYQTGEAIQESNPVVNQVASKTNPYDDYVSRILNTPVGGGIYENQTEQAIESGFGTSRFDTDYTQGSDVENQRALNQPWISKVGAGAVKGLVRAGTTAANTVVGTVAGVLAGIADPFVDSDNDGKNGFREALDAATSNWVSTKLVGLQEAMEELVPNYRTSRERSEEYQRQWYRPSHLLSANSIADFLSNFGFTAGAVLAGAGISKYLGKAMSKKLAGDIMKGVAVGAEGDAEALAQLKNVTDALNRGTIVTVDASKLSENLQSVAKRINSASSRLQLYGAALGAIGEGSVEGLMAKNEFLEDYGKKIQNDFISKYTNAENELVAENDARFVGHAKIEQDGESIDIPYLTDYGKAELEKRKNDYIDAFRAQEQDALEQADRLASVTQLLNIPILTVTNTVQFGRILSGGWRTSRANAGKIAGRSPVTAKGIDASYSANGSLAGKTILESLKVAGTEGAEEMVQGFISSGTKNVAEERLTSFNDASYNYNPIRAFSRDYFRTLLQGGADYLGDIKNWNEGFLGAFTGLLGIPGKRWGGGGPGAYQEAKEELNASREAADKLNKLVNSSDFRSRWEGYVRHMKFDDDLKNATAADDKYAWHTADDNMLISDVIAFADAGRLNDLDSIVDYYANLTTANASDIRDINRPENSDSGQNNAFDNKSDEEVVGSVKKQAQRMKNAIQQYRDIYDAISAIAPRDASSSYLKEIVATAMQIKAFDERFLTMFDEVSSYVKTASLALASVDENGNMRSPEDIQNTASLLRNQYEEAIAGSLIPSNLSFVQKGIDSVLDKFEDSVKSDPEAQKKLQDMRKLSNARKEFYRKLKYLQTEAGQTEFEEEKVDQTKVEEAAETAAANIETQQINNLSDVKAQYFGKPARERKQYIQTLEKAKDKNPGIKTFLDMKKKYDGFVEYYNSHFPNFSNFPATSDIMVKNLVDDVLKRAQSVDEVENLPDSVFQPFGDFVQSNSAIFGLPPTDVNYEATKSLIRDVMKAYLGIDTATGSRETLSPVAKKPETPAIPATPEGRDSAQPASVTEKPESDKRKRGRKKAAVETQQTRTAEEQVQYVPSSSIAEADRASDAVVSAFAEETDATAESEEQTVKKGNRSQKLYYQSSVPEIDSSEAANARAAIMHGDREGLEKANLSDFVINHPEYAEIWNALKDAGAFDYVASRLGVGTKDNPTEISFIIDEKFPRYKGKPQILVATEVDGRYQVLSVLSSKEGDYFGLKELRAEIISEYTNARNSGNTDDVFVFSKKSTVWGKRQGLIEYDFSENADKNIVDIPGYSDDARIVFVDGNGVARLVKGDSDGFVMPSTLADTSGNRGESGSGIDRRGSLYYVVDSGDGRYIPIRLNVEHFNDRTKSSNNGVFQKIRNSISKIAEIARTTDSTNVADKGSALAKEVNTLAKLLDIHDVDFVLRDWGGDIGVALAVNTIENGKRVEDSSAMFRPYQATDNALISLIASFDKSPNIKYYESEYKLGNLNELITSGLLTSNATRLRPKGVDFYFNAYNPETGEFGRIEPVVPEQTPVDTSTDTTPEVPASLSEEDAPVPQLDDIADDFEEIGEVEFLDEKLIGAGNSQATQTETEALGAEEAESEAAAYLNAKFAELPKSIKDRLIKDGYSEDEWDNRTSQTVKEKKLSCM